MSDRGQTWSKLKIDLAMGGNEPTAKQFYAYGARRR